MNAMGISGRRHAVLFAAGLLLLASLVKAPAIYFCPEMGALPLPCCTRQAADGLGGSCCRFIAMEQDGAVGGTVSISPAPPAGDCEAARIVMPLMPSAASPDRLTRHRDPDRASPASLQILLSTFLC
jgi:hypothetical protein